MFLGGDDVTEHPPYKRDVNTVFQSYALFPHLNVERNVALRPRAQARSRKDEVRKRVGEALELVQLAGLGQRKPGQLSGGQQQRVALARALVNRPRALLLDEPLGALDLRLRKQLQIELKRIQQDVGITFVHVTHDQEEAMTMADTIAVMNDGQDRAGRLGRRALRAPAHRVRGQLPRRLEPDRRPRCARATATLARVETHDGATLRVPAERIGPHGTRRRPRRRAAREDHAACPPARDAARRRQRAARARSSSPRFLGVSIQYLVRAAGGEELTVFAPELDGAEPEALGRRPRGRSWPGTRTTPSSSPRSSR